MKQIDIYQNYTREQAIELVPILTARQVPATVSGSELQRLAVRAAIKRFNDEQKGGGK